jgi:hypothetical protein
MKTKVWLLLLIVFATLAIQLVPTHPFTASTYAAFRDGGSPVPPWRDGGSPVPPWRDGGSPVPPWRDGGSPVPPWQFSS